MKTKPLRILPNGLASNQVHQFTPHDLVPNTMNTIPTIRTHAIQTTIVKPKELNSIITLVLVIH